MWSVGCVLAELLTLKPLFPGKAEIDQINRIFKVSNLFRVILVFVRVVCVRLRGKDAKSWNEF